MSQPKALPRKNARKLVHTVTLSSKVFAKLQRQARAWEGDNADVSRFLDTQLARMLWSSKL